MRLPGLFKHRERGVALLTALLVVAVATLAAVAMATRQQMDIRRTGNLLHGEQAYAYALAAESWARVILLRDMQDSETDDLSEEWSTALPPSSVEGGTVEGLIEDLQGRYNINNLVGPDGNVVPEELAYFKQLLNQLDLEEQLADALIDWIDPNIETRFPDGAEDDVYLGEEVPYRTGNRYLSSISELRLVKGFTQEIFMQLSPYLVALPNQTTLNINTADPRLINALNQNMSESDVESMLEGRAEKGFENKADFLGHENFAGQEVAAGIDVTTNYFAVHTNVVIGQGRARLLSLMQRTDEGVRVLSRIREVNTGQPLRVVVEDEES